MPWSANPAQVSISFANGGTLAAGAGVVAG
jgi:hypothetical protein